jgi:hypothetical protein
MTPFSFPVLRARFGRHLKYCLDANSHTGNFGDKPTTGSYAVEVNLKNRSDGLAFSSLLSPHLVQRKTSMSTPDPTPTPDAPTAETSTPEASKPGKGRSPIERAAVWGGILVLLLVVGAEWKSQADYNATLNKLEDQITGGNRLLAADLPQHIRGYAVRSEGTRKDERIITLHWPSLFKTYKLILPVEPNDLISSFETADWQPIPASATIPPTTPAQPADSQPMDQAANRRPAEDEPDAEGPPERAAKDATNEGTAKESPAKKEAPKEEPADGDANKPDAKADDKAKP